MIRPYLIAILTIGISLVPLLINAQDEIDMPTFGEYYNLTPTNWEDSTLSNQILKWKNGRIRLEYKHVKDSIRLRKEYFQSGNLKLTAEVYQVWGIDSLYTEDLETRELTLTVSEGRYVDIFHGEFLEFTDLQGIGSKTEGQFNHGLMVGDWKTKTDKETIVVASFNNHGSIDGLYQEYYSLTPDSAQIKLEGQFGVVYSRDFVEDLETGELVEVLLGEIKKVGDWKHYDLSGNLVLTVSYNWESN